MDDKRKGLELTERGEELLKVLDDGDFPPEAILYLEVMGRLKHVDDTDKVERMMDEMIDHYGSVESAIAAVRSDEVVL